MPLADSPIVDASVLLQLTDYMGRLGAEYSEARYHSITGFNAFYLSGSLIQASPSDSSGIAFRAVVDGGLGFSSTSKLDMDSLKSAAKRAVAAARAASRLVKRKVEMGPGLLGTARYSVIERKPLSSIPDVDRSDTAAEIASSAEPPKGVEASVSLFYMDQVEHKILVSSDGALVESVIPRVYIFYNLNVKYNGERRTRFFELGGSGGFEIVENIGIDSTIEDDYKSLYTVLSRAVSPPHGKLDVILGPEVVGLIVHESAGHPSEADRVLGREAAQAGLSYRMEKPVGYRIGSEHVTVIDDPTIPGSLGFYLYDDEGVRARPRRLIENGMLSELLHNRETAAIYGVESNAAARAMNYMSEPIVRMANTYMAPGDYSFEELIEEVELGVYIKKYMEWNIDDYRWKQRYVGLEAYLVRNGRLAEPVRDPVFEVTSEELYSSIDAVGRDLRFYSGICGKGEPPQGVPVWFGGPHVRVRGVRI